MQTRKCSHPSPLFALKHDLVITYSESSKEQPQHLSKAMFEARTKLVKEYRHKEYGRVLPEQYSGTCKRNM